VAQATGPSQHEFRAPARGDGNGATTDCVALPGLALFCVRYRWLAPPANFLDASGVRFSIDMLGHFAGDVTVMTPFMPPA
jgi:hypothetical protein